MTTPRCPRCNQFLPLLGVHRCPCEFPGLRFVRWLFRDRRDDDPDRPDWQALVDAVDFAADIASPRFDGKPHAHVVEHRVAAQSVADIYYTSNLREAVDGELFALEAALAAYPNDFFGRWDTVRRYDYLFNREPQPTRIGHWATWLVASTLAFVVLLAVAGNAAPRTGPAVVPTQSGAPLSMGTIPGPSDQLVAPTLGRSSDAPTHGASLTPPSLPAAASLPVAEPIRTSAPVPTPPPTDTEPVIRGIASHMGDSPDAGPGYLALPIGPGHRVRLCGAMGCLVLTSNDAGPALFMQRRGRVADLSVELFERLTGLPRSRGLAPISWRELP